MGESKPDENLIATIYYENGTELTGKAVTLQDGTVGVRIPGEFFKTALLPDGSMPDGVKSVNIGPKHVEGGLPLTDDMVCMAVTAMLRDAVGLTLGEASDAYETWLNRAKRATIEHEARVGLPRMWEHPRRTRTRRGGVVASMVGGYTAILLVRQPNGVENSIRRQCSTLNEAEKWLDEQMGEDE